MELKRENEISGQIRKQLANESSYCLQPEISTSVKLKQKMVLVFRDHWDSVKVAFTRFRNFCSTFIAGTCIVLLILSLLAIAFKPANKIINVLLIDIDRNAQFITDTKFLSIALDSSLIAEDFRNFNLTNPKILRLLKALSPGYLRIGGTMADRLWFEPEGTFKFKTSTLNDIDGGECAYEGINCDKLILPNFTMSGKEWLSLNKLASDAGLTVLFDLNCLTRHENGSWNSNNTEELIEFSNKHSLNVAWELGNEPNAFQHVFNYNVNASQLALDFIQLRTILNKYPLYKNAFLVGPDTTRPLPNNRKSIEYLQNFVQIADNYINAVTWHQYYLNGRTASYLDFLNPNILNILKYQINTIYETVRAVEDTPKKIWLGETSSAYGGGAPGYSDRYIASFMWLDKLGIAAQSGIDVVIRQSFFKGYYALIYDDLTPSPDWWVSVIYKHLVGPEVVPCHGTSSALVRLYCHCTVHDTAASSITVFGVNMKSTDAKIRLEGLLPVMDHPYSQKVSAYILTTNLNLLSKVIILNDEYLNLLPSGDIPIFKPKIVESQPYLVMPPFSLVFWVVPSPSLHYCFQ